MNLYACMDCRNFPAQAAAAAGLVALAGCGLSDRLAGGPVPTGNAIVAGRVLDSSGTGAAAARVRMIPEGYHPLRGPALPPAWSGAADGEGRYALHALKAGRYNLEASDAGGAKLLAVGLEVREGDTVRIPEATLRAPGSLILALPDSGDPFLYVQGTSLSAPPRYPSGLPGFALLAGVPAGRIPAVYAWRDGSPGEGRRVGGGAVIAPGDTAVLPGLPAPWAGGDVGQAAPPGGAAFALGAFLLSGPGPDTSARADDLHFVSQARSGDLVMTARLKAVEHAHPAAMAALMLRDSLTAGARQLNLAVSAAGIVAFHHRDAPGDSLRVELPVLTCAFPCFLRLERRGDVFTGAVSRDGATWETVGSATVALPAEMHAGLAASSRHPGRLATAVFDFLTLISP